MKCPYCGAEVAPNSKCEYCDSFVEREEKETNSKKEYAEILGEFIFESAEHLAEGLRNASYNTNNTDKENNTDKAEEYEETIKRVSSPENKRIMKNLIITFSLIIIVPVICYIIFLCFALWSNFFQIFRLW